jgi:hypothetical protein
MTSTDLDDLLRHAAERGEVVLYTPGKDVPAKGEHRRPVVELVPAPTEGEGPREYAAEDDNA